MYLPRDADLGLRLQVRCTPGRLRFALAAAHCPKAVTSIECTQEQEQAGFEVNSGARPVEAVHSADSVLS